MAINLKISTNDKPLFSNEIVYKRLFNQSPLDFAISYLEQMEDIFSFYKEFNMISYTDFYNNDKYRIEKKINPMRLNNYESATLGEPFIGDRGRIYADGQFRIYDNINSIRIYK